MADMLVAGAQTAFVIACGLTTLYLVLGLVRPSWARAPRRRSVVARPLALILLAGVGFIGVIGYTLMLPDNPHALDRYLKDFDMQSGALAQGQ